MDQNAIKFLTLLLSIIFSNFVLSQTNTKDDSIRLLAKGALYTHNLKLELDVLPWEEIIYVKPNEKKVKISVILNDSINYVKISSLKKKIKLKSQRPTRGSYHGVHLIDGKKDILVNVELEIFHHGKWKVYQIKENQNPQRHRTIGVKKNNSVLFQLDKSFIYYGNIEMKAKIALKVKNNIYYSNEFNVYLNQEQIDSAREYFKWSENEP